MFGGKIPSLTLQPVITCGKSFIWDVWQCFEFAFVAINYFWKTVRYLFTEFDEYILPYIKQYSNVQGQIPKTLCSTYFLNKATSKIFAILQYCSNVGCGVIQQYCMRNKKNLSRQFRFNRSGKVNCRKCNCPIATFIRRWHSVDIAWICQRPKIIKFHVFLI